jgi:hypothetical protein
MTGAHALVEALAAKTGSAEIKVQALQGLHAVSAGAR